ncbi:hypothetical protein C8J56DRAFT_892468 [Mycena floridula]|nr:hypothetical protein C8J56DRAFT_892468 [Mycena floridula]
MAIARFGASPAHWHHFANNTNCYLGNSLLMMTRIWYNIQWTQSYKRHDSATKDLVESFKTAREMVHFHCELLAHCMEEGDIQLFDLQFSLQKRDHQADSTFTARVTSAIGVYVSEGLKFYPSKNLIVVLRILHILGNTSPEIIVPVLHMTIRNIKDARKVNALSNTHMSQTSQVLEDIVPGSNNGIMPAEDSPGQELMSSGIPFSTETYTGKRDGPSEWARSIFTHSTLSGNTPAVIFDSENLPGQKKSHEASGSEIFSPSLEDTSESSGSHRLNAPHNTTRFKTASHFYL